MVKVSFPSGTDAKSQFLNACTDPVQIVSGRLYLRTEIYDPIRRFHRGLPGFLRNSKTNDDRGDQSTCGAAVLPGMLQGLITSVNDLHVATMTTAQGRSTCPVSKTSS